MNKKSESAKLKKRDTIILSAKELIIKNGYQRTNVEDITKNIDIAKGSFYTYFKSKDQMVLEIINEAYNFIRAKNEEILSRDLSGMELVELNVKRRFEINEEAIFNILFFYHLSMNLESISAESKREMFKIKDCNVANWQEVIKRYKPEITQEKLVRYSQYIDELLAFSMRSILFYSEDLDQIFTSDFDLVIERTKSDVAKKEMEILCETILKIIG